MTRRSAWIVLFGMLMLVAVLAPVSAGTNSGATFTIDCEGFQGTGGSIILDRDNTGSNREAFVVSATDGAGNIIYQPEDDSFFVGGSISWSGSQMVEWTSAPRFNPITLRVVSLEGNGLDSQTILRVTGSCTGLPLYGFPAIISGDTSASVALNAPPPRPVNDDDDIAGLPGYLLVNTDNLSLRSGDGVIYTQVAVVDGGSRLIPLGRNEDFTWWLVQAGDIIGWGTAEFLVARGDLTDVPVIQAEGIVSPNTFFLFSSAPLLSLPDGDALALCTVPGNLEYVALGRSSDGLFYQVQAICDRVPVNGWLEVALGAYRSQTGAALPVVSP
jgi:hypothetical protein